MFSILAAAAEVAGKNGEVIKAGSASFIVAALPFVLVLVILGLVFSFLFYRKRLEHKQIMAAIEKGIPLSELRPAKKTGPAWIRNVAVGVAALLISFVSFMTFIQWVNIGGFQSRQLLLPVFVGTVTLAMGCALVILGGLQRKAERRALALEKGIPLSELERSNWITSFSVGIGFLIFSLIPLFAFVEPLIRDKDVTSQNLLVFGIFFAIGVPFLFRGLLLRKAQRQIKSPGQVDAEDIKKPNLKSPNSKLKAQN